MVHNEINADRKRNLQDARSQQPLKEQVLESDHFRMSNVPWETAMQTARVGPVLRVQS